MTPTSLHRETMGLNLSSSGRCLISITPQSDFLNSILFFIQNESSISIYLILIKHIPIVLNHL